MSRDCSKLRPFDLEAARRGEPICTARGCAVSFVSGPDSGGNICVVGTSGLYTLLPPQALFMAPLAWHQDGTPIYAGDPIWSTVTGVEGKVTHVSPDEKVLFCKKGDVCEALHWPSMQEFWSHTPPKRTIRIGEFDVPEPERRPLEKGQGHFVAILDSLNRSYYRTWDSTVHDFRWLERGLIHLTKEAAELHSRALLSFTSREGEA